MTSTPQETPPEACPGTQSEAAGQSEACQGCPNQSLCSSSSSAIKAPDPDLPLLTSRLSLIQHKLLILSGKGGVGKSTLSTNLAWALSSDQQDNPHQDLPEVGLLDVDITGPSLPKMLAVENESIHSSNSGWSPVYVKDNLALMSIGFLLSSPDEAVIWRGPKKNAIIKQFLKDVNWGPLDYLLIDTPPGTSDEHLSLVTYLQNSGIDGAILVTTPQELSLQDVRKELSFCRKLGLRVLGLVENMSEFICPK